MKKYTGFEVELAKGNQLAEILATPEKQAEKAVFVAKSLNEPQEMVSKVYAAKKTPLCMANFPPQSKWVGFEQEKLTEGNLIGTWQIGEGSLLTKKIVEMVTFVAITYIGATEAQLPKEVIRGIARQILRDFSQKLSLEEINLAFELCGQGKLCTRDAELIEVPKVYGSNSNLTIPQFLQVLQGYIIYRDRFEGVSRKFEEIEQEKIEEATRKEQEAVLEAQWKDQLKDLQSMTAKIQAEAIAQASTDKIQFWCGLLPNPPKDTKVQFLGQAKEAALAEIKTQLEFGNVSIGDKCYLEDCRDYLNGYKTNDLIKYSAENMVKRHYAPILLRECLKIAKELNL